MNSIEIPESQQVVPWVQSLVCLTQEQVKTIQAQVEQIAQLKMTVQELRDEIARLKNTPKRPQFRPSGTPSNMGEVKGYEKESEAILSAGLQEAP